MQLRDITEQQFEAIAAEIDNPTLQCGAIEMISGLHDMYGMTILLRDAQRCMVLTDDPTPLDLAHSPSTAAAAGRFN